MTLTVHHLQVSQSERVVWLCEELGVPYTLTLHQRDPVFSPQSIKDLNPLGQAPVIQDGDLTLAESAAVVEYIIHKHGGGRLSLAPSHRNYADYLYWFHMSNSNMQPLVLTLLHLSSVGNAGDRLASTQARFDKLLTLLDTRLTQNTWLAGDDFTAADIMIVFTLTTMRVFYGYDLSGRPGILAFLDRATKREAYKRARAKGDPELELMIEGPAPKPFIARLKEAGKI